VTQHALLVLEEVQRVGHHGTVERRDTQLAGEIGCHKLQP
jgi:hypothetical protein